VDSDLNLNIVALCRCVLAAGRTSAAGPWVLCGEAVASFEEHPTCAYQTNEYAVRDDDDQG